MKLSKLCLKNKSRCSEIANRRNFCHLTKHMNILSSLMIRNRIVNDYFKENYSCFFSSGSMVMSNTYCDRHRHLLNISQTPKGSVLEGFVQKRFKKRIVDSKREMDSDDDDEEDEDDVQEDFDAPTNYGEFVTYLKSIRADSVISTGLDYTRNRAEQFFYSGSLRVNNSPLLKKSKSMDVGDFVDLVTEKSEDKKTLKVKRVKIVKISSEKTKTGKYKVKLRTWKSSFEVNVEGVAGFSKSSLDDD